MAIYNGTNGDDTIAITCTTGGADVVHGGAGTDSLSIDASAIGGGISWQAYNGTSYVSNVSATSSLANIQTFLAVPYTLNMIFNSFVRGIFDGIENLSLTASSNSYNDLLFALGTGTYAGGAGTDTFYADWSTATGGITWNNTGASV